MMRLLAAEDDQVIRRELSRDLENHGYEVVVPENFEDAEDIVRRGEVHLAVSYTHLTLPTILLV